MKKILVDLRKLSNRPSGIGYYIYMFLKSIIGEEKIQVYGVTDLVVSNEIKDLRDKNIIIYEYGEEVSKSIKVYKYNNYIYKILRENEFDYFWQPNFILPSKFNKLTNVKKIITIHDISPIQDEEFYGLIYKLYFKIFLKNSIRNTDIILYDSNFSKKSTEEVFEEAKYKVNLVTYIPFEHEYSRYGAIDEEYFAYIGNIEKRKGVHLLIDSYEEYLNMGGQRLLVIAGGMRDKGIEEQIKRFNIKYDNKITYLGYIEEEKKNKIIRNCSAVIFPSFSEGFGIPPLETIFLSKKTIVSDIEVLKEVLEEAGEYFNLDKYNYKNSIKNLAIKMFNIDDITIDMKKIEKLRKKYDGKNLSNHLLNILD